MITYVTFEGLNIFKDRDYSDNYSVCGLCWRVGGELIGPCIWNRQWLEHNVKFNVVYHQFVLIKTEDDNLCVFFPISELKVLTEELYLSIIEEFKLQIKKFNTKMKMDRIANDF